MKLLLDTHAFIWWDESSSLAGLLSALFIAPALLGATAPVTTKPPAVAAQPPTPA
jgi:hypothetical protein